MIYFIQATDGTGPVKIGYSKEPSARIRDFQTVSAKPLQVIAIIPGNLMAEQRLHRRFAHLREHGEWFRVEDELLEFLTFLRDFVSGKGMPDTKLLKVPDKALIDQIRSERDYLRQLVLKHIDPQYSSAAGRIPA